MSKGWKFYWVLVFFTTTNYLVMVLWSLPTISQMAGGQVPFDMRPLGYSFSDAQLLLSALDASARSFYLHTQQTLDLFYPTLLAISVAIPLNHLLPRYWGIALAMVPIAAGIFDHLENHAVAQLLRAEPGAITEVMVANASNWTLAKSVSTTIALVALLVVLLVKGALWLKNRNLSAGGS